jgi:DNA-binding NtrC family response regulator
MSSAAGGDTPTGGAPGVDAAPLSLVVLHTPDPALRGRVIPIGSGLSIGRNADSVDLPINDRLLSRCHATVAPVGDSHLCEVVDHESRNGSFVEGLRVTRSHLTRGSILRLGVTLFEVSRDAEEPAATLDDDLDESEPLMGRSSAFRQVIGVLSNAARGVEPVIITGEAGTGKKRAAKRLHLASGRPGRFVVAHCGGSLRLTEAQLFGGVDSDAPDTTSADGLVPMADGGTLVLDEADLLDPPLQDRLFSLLETGEYRPASKNETRRAEVRVVACSAANLEAAVQAGAFSRALFERLAACALEMPSLRDRRRDIPLLAQHFLKVEAPARRFDWSATCLEKLLLYDWPGNVRELHNVMRRLTLVDDDVTVLRSAHLPKEIRKRLRTASEDSLRYSAITVHAVPSRAELARLLEEFEGNVARVAEHYAKDRRHVYRWLTRHDLSAADFRK